MMMDLKMSPSDPRETRKLRKILNEEIRLGIKVNSDSEEEEKVNLRNEIYPLGHYINDREDMIEEMFSLIKGDKLRKMLPPILKDMPLDELKADCLIHLLGMSKKRIYSILEGRQIDSSSDSESHSDSYLKQNKKERSIVKPIMIKQEGCSDISDNSEEVVLIDPDGCESVVSKSKKRSKKGGKRTKSSEKHGKSREVKKKKMITNVEKELKHPVKKQQSNVASDSENDNGEAAVPTGGKNLLEILELEMRARAIRALLHKDGPKDYESNKIIGETTSLKNHSDSNGSAENSDEEACNNKVTPARNIRKRKLTNNDDVIVVAPKLVTIDLTDEIDSRLKNKTPQKTFDDSVVPRNKHNKSIALENDPAHDKPSNSRQESESDALNNKEDEPESSVLNGITNKHKSMVLDDNEPEEKTPCVSGPKTGLSSNKECEIEDGQLDRKEEDCDHDVLKIKPEDSEQDNTDISPNIENISIKPTELDIGDSSINKSELLEIGETVILSDDDSTLSESNSVVDIDRTEPNNGNIKANSEVGKSTNSSEQMSTQSVRDYGDITKDANAKKNWAQRWLDSKEVKKVVSTSKLCGNIRKRIKIAKMAKKKSLEDNQNDNKPDHQPDIAPPPQDIQGSVDEYQLLPKSIAVYSADRNDGVGEECKAVENEVRSLNVPTIGSIPENTSLNEQVQDVTSTENTEHVNIKDQSSDSKSIDESNQALQQLPVMIETNTCDKEKNETNHCDKEQNKTKSNTNNIDEITVLKTCDSSNEQADLDENCAIIQNDNRLRSSNEQTEVLTKVDTTSDGKQAQSSPGLSVKETCLNETPQTDKTIKLSISENVPNNSNDSNDKLQTSSLVVTNSETTNDKKTNETLDPDQNGPETLEINITDEELEIDGIISDIIDPCNEGVVWSKSEILEID